MLPRLLLVGSGPTHLLLLEILARRTEPAREAILVSPVNTEMSPGSLPGLLAGRYRPSEVGVNLDRLTQAAGVRIVHSAVRSLEPGSRTVRLEDGETLLYNAASIALGPFPAGSRVPGAARYAHYINTLDRAMALVPALETAIHEAPEQLARVIVVGGSSEAFEIAMSLRAALDRLNGGRGVVTMISAAHAVWRERGVGARLAEAAIQRNDISAILGAQIEEVQDHRLRLSNGAWVAFDLLIWAVGDQAPDYMAGPDAHAGRDRHVVVDEYLQAVEAPALFVAGEVILKQDDQLRQIGVDPVEGARVIADNLLAILAGKSPSRTYSPKRRIRLAETGGESALLSYGALGLESRWLMTLKQRADRNLMRRLAGLPR
jgi:NADH dehydrogenase FAD-containing subunit